jgi:hypothetical protein
MGMKAAEYCQGLPESVMSLSLAQSASQGHSRVQPSGTDLACTLPGIHHSDERTSMAPKQILVLVALSAFAAPVFAVDGSAVIGGAIGGGTGAAVGSALGGRDGAIIGGAIGGAAGAAIATSGSKPATQAVTRDVVVQKEVVYVPAHHDNGLHRGHHKDKHGHD